MQNVKLTSGVARLAVYGEEVEVGVEAGIDPAVRSGLLCYLHVELAVLVEVGRGRGEEV